MAVTSRNMRTSRVPQWNGRRVVRVSAEPQPRVALATPAMVQPQPQSMRLINAAQWATVIILLSLVVGTLNGWVGTKIDDLRYGRPRVSHLVARVGHGAAGLPSEFIALNLNRRVVVLEFPGGDAEQVRTIVGPYLFGADEDLTPITLNIHDVNGDQAPDLLVNIKNEQLVYINDTQNFRMITAGEQQQLQPTP